MGGLKKMMYGSLKAPVTGSTLLQTVRINLDNTNRGAISGWNNWIGSGSNSLNLVNSAGAASGMLLAFVSGAFDSEDEGSQTDSLFPASVLQYMINRSGSIVTQFTGLNAARTYKLTFAAVQNYTDPGDKTDIVLNGVTTSLNGPSSANTVYKVTAPSVVNPASGIINMTFAPSSGASYACMNGLIIEEYS
jgi:hypothetical protein